MGQGLQGGVDPQVVAGFDRYLEQEGEPGPDETRSEEEVRATSRATAEETREESEEPAQTDTEETPVVEDPDDEHLQDEERVTAPPEETDEEEGAPIDTWAELSTSLGLEPDELSDHIMHEIGEERVSTAELIRTYTDGPTLNATAQAELDTARTEMRTEVDASMKELTAATARIIGRIEQHRAPEGGWDALRESNPGEYIRLQELQSADRRDAESALASMQREGERREGEDKKADEKWEADQNALLFKLKPEWRQPAKAKAAFEDVSKYLEGRYTEAQITNLRDAQSIITAWEAAQWRKLQAKKPGLRKRLRKLPRKNLRATARDETAPARAQNKNREARLNRFEKSGRIEDAIEFFGEHVK